MDRQWPNSDHSPAPPQTCTRLSQKKRIPIACFLLKNRLLIIGSGFWYSFIAALILINLYSCSTDLSSRLPLSLGLYSTAVELRGCDIGVLAQDIHNPYCPTAPSLLLYSLSYSHIYNKAIASFKTTFKGHSIIMYLNHASAKNVINTQNQCQIWIYLKTTCCVELNIVLWNRVNLNFTEILKAAMEKLLYFWVDISHKRATTCLTVNWTLGARVAAMKVDGILSWELTWHLLWKFPQQ